MNILEKQSEGDIAETGDASLWSGKPVAEERSSAELLNLFKKLRRSSKEEAAPESFLGTR